MRMLVRLPLNGAPRSGQRSFEFAVIAPTVRRAGRRWSDLGAQTRAQRGSARPNRPGGGLGGDLVELAGGDVEHESAQRLVLRHERAGPDAAQRLADVL